MRLLSRTTNQLIYRGIFKNNQLFVTYIASFFLVFLLPVLILSFLVFNYIFYSFEEEVIKSNNSSLNQVKSTLDMNFEELNRIMYQVYYKPEITSYSNMADPLKGMEAIKILRNSILANPFIHEIILYTGESNYLLSSTGSYTIPNFIGTIYKYAKWNQSELVYDLEHQKRPYFRPAEDVLINNQPKRLITGIFPDTMNKRSLLFLINEDTLLHTLNSFRGNMAVFDHHNQLIATTLFKPYLYSESFSQFIESKISSGHTTMNIEGIDYIISFTKSESTKWAYVSLLPVHEVMGDLQQIKMMFIYALIGIFLIGSAIILLVTRYNYNPIKQLKTFAETHYGNSVAIANELDAVKYTIDRIAESNTVLKEKIRLSQPALKDFILTSFLKGNFKDINDFNDAAKEIGLHFTKSYCQIVIIHIHNFENYVNSMDDISEELEKNLPEGLEGYCKNNIEDNKLVMILSTDQENNHIQTQMNYLMKYLIDQWDIYSTIGVSSSCNHVSYMWKSYIEASTALDYRFIKGNYHVILFSELTVQYNEQSIYSSQSIENLSMCIKNGDFDRVDKYIDDLVRKVKENSSLFMARCACFDIINTIMRTVYDINKTFVVNDHDTFDLITLMKFETAEDLADTVKTFCFDICEFIQTIKSDTKHNLKNEINTYIDNHCCNLDFSIQATADLFKMSLSNLGQYFKSHTGSTISDYVCNVQIEKAKELLKSSDESIQNIVRKVGHYDSSNFIRKFKQIVGMTPGEYRKMCRNSSSRH